MVEDQQNESGTGEGSEDSQTPAPAAAASAPKVTTSTRRRRTTTPKVVPTGQDEPTEPAVQDPPALAGTAIDDADAEATPAPADSSLPPDEPDESPQPATPAVTTTTRRRPARKAAAAAPVEPSSEPAEAPERAGTTAEGSGGSTETPTVTTTTRTRTRSTPARRRAPAADTAATPDDATAPDDSTTAAASVDRDAPEPAAASSDEATSDATTSSPATTTRTSTTTRTRRGRGASSAGVVFQAPDVSRATTAAAAGAVAPTDEPTEDTTDTTDTADTAASVEESTTGSPVDGSDDAAGLTDTTATAEEATEDSDEEKPARRRRRRGGRRRRRGRGDTDDSTGDDSADAGDDETEGATSSGSGADDDTQAGTTSEAEGTSGPRKAGNTKGGTGAAGTDGAKQSKSSKDSTKSEDSTDGKDEHSSEAGATTEPSEQDPVENSGDDTDEQGSGSRRRRRRRRSGDSGGSAGSGGGNRAGDDPENTVTRVRKGRSPEDEITALQGSTRLEAKKQRRREGREAGRRKAPIVSEAEFLARREAVDRTMVVRQGEDLTQIAVLEDKVLVEHYVARKSQTSMIGNVYLGKVQNVLPSMEAAFIDIGKGRNAVLYAGEVNWRAVGAKEGQPRKIEQVLKSGQTVLVQVSKDPIGQKGARLTGQVSLPGRFLVYVPDGTTSGISRKLPDTERSRLKTLLKQIVPSTAGVIVRTAAEGASEEELTRDVERLTSQWEAIEKKVAKGNGPQMLYGEPDLTLKVVRDVFTEDFAKLVVSGDEAWDLVHDYVSSMAPDLLDRVEHHTDEDDVFAAHRIDEQITKALDNKVWLPSGGSLIIDRTEAMTVVDVNTGKFTGSGGNLEETVTKNNLEAAEELVRQLRLRDIGGIIVVDFIDMVLENNRDLVLRRLIECLGRDRTRHQVAEVTSLGLVQMTRKRIGTGLLDSFSETCSHCKGQGHTITAEPVEPAGDGDDQRRRGRSGKGRGAQSSDNGGNGNGGNGGNGGKSSNGRSGKNAGAGEEASKPRQGPPPALLAAMAGHDKKADSDTTDAADGSATTDATRAAEAGAVDPTDTVEPGDAVGFGQAPALDPVTEEGTEPAPVAEAPAEDVAGTDDPTEAVPTSGTPPVDVEPGADDPAPAPRRGRSSGSRRGGARKAAAAPPAVALPESDGAPTTAAGASAAAAGNDGGTATTTTTRTTRTTRRRSGRTATPAEDAQQAQQADVTAPSVAPHETASTGAAAATPPAEPSGRDGDPAGDSSAAVTDAVRETD